jgi:hypothetical protein
MKRSKAVAFETFEKYFIHKESTNNRGGEATTSIESTARINLDC